MFLPQCYSYYFIDCGGGIPGVVSAVIKSARNFKIHPCVVEVEMYSVCYLMGVPIREWVVWQLTPFSIMAVLLGDASVNANNHWSSERLVPSTHFLWLILPQCTWLCICGLTLISSYKTNKHFTFSWNGNIVGVACIVTCRVEPRHSRLANLARNCFLIPWNCVDSSAGSFWGLEWDLTSLYWEAQRDDQVIYLMSTGWPGASVLYLKCSTE